MNEHTSLLARRADQVAREAAANAPDRWFCRTCQVHRVRRPESDCPCCGGES